MVHPPGPSNVVGSRRKAISRPLEPKLLGTMQPRKYPPILPARPPQREGESSPSPQQSPSKDQPAKRSGGKQVACNECRRRKTKVSIGIYLPFFVLPSPAAPLPHTSPPFPFSLTQFSPQDDELTVLQCDGQRPMCSNCRKRGVSSCIYTEKLESVPEVLVEVLRLLKSLPDNRASDLLRILRENDDPATVLSRFRGDRVGDQPYLVPDSEYEATPAAQNSLESELGAKNPTSYPALAPVLLSVLAESNLLRPLRESVLVNQE